MKFISHILVCLLFLNSYNTYAQVSTNEGTKTDQLYSEDDGAIGVSSIYLNYDNFATRIGYGINFSKVVTDNVVFTWHLHFGNRFFSTSMWAPLGPLLFAASVGTTGNLDKYTLGLLLLSILPDGVTFPFRISDRFFIAPSISPFWLDMFGKDAAYKRFYISGNIGLNFYFKTDYFNIHPFAAVSLLYKKAPNFGYYGGIGIEIPLSVF